MQAVSSPDRLPHEWPATDRNFYVSNSSASSYTCGSEWNGSTSSRGAIRSACAIVLYSMQVVGSFDISSNGRLSTRLYFGLKPGRVQYKRSQIIIVGCVPIFFESLLRQSLLLQITIMSSVVPWDGVYRIQNVAYPEQKIGLKDTRDVAAVVIIVGRHEDSINPRIKWEIKATTVSENSKIIIKSDSSSISNYVGADSEKVVYSATPYEWNVSYREVGRWIIQDPDSHLLLQLPHSDDGTEVRLVRDGAGDASYWRFIPIRPPSN